MKKKELRILTIASLVAILLLITSVTVLANDVQSAENIAEGGSYGFACSEEDTEHYYKFAPHITDYYEINVSNFIADETYIEVTDAYGTEIAFSGWDQYTNTTRLACRLVAGKVYYIRISAYPESGSRVLNTSIHRHNHSFKPASGSNGFYYQECRTPRCEYTSFTIQGKPSITKLKKGKKRFTVTWKNKTTGFDYYQIQYSTSKTFKNAKTINVSYVTDKKTIKGLKKKKKYYIRIRAGHNYEENYGEIESFYGPWSKVKSVKTK